MAHQEGVPCGRKTQQQAGSRIAKYLHRKKRSRESKLDETLKAHTSDILLPARKATSAKPPQRVSPTGDQVFIELRLWGTLVIQTATDGSGSGTKWRHEKTNDPNQKSSANRNSFFLPFSLLACWKSSTLRGQPVASSLIQMLIVSSNIIIDAARIMFNRVSGHLLLQSDTTALVLLLLDHSLRTTDLLHE